MSGTKPWTIGSSGGDSGNTKEDSSEAPVNKRCSSPEASSGEKEEQDRNMKIVVVENNAGAGSIK